MKNRLPAGISYSDFAHGFHIIDLRTENEMVQLNQETGLPIDILSVPFEQDETNLSFDDKMQLRIMEALEVFKLFVEPADAWIQLLNDKINKPVIAWAYNNGMPDIAINQEMLDEVIQETKKEVIKVLTFASRIQANNKLLSTEWGDKTESRIQWLITSTRKLKAVTPVPESKDIISMLIEKMIQAKIPVKGLTKIISSIIGLAYSYADTDIKIKFTDNEANNVEIYNNVRNATHNYIWWHFIERMYNETPTEGEEPVELIQRDELSGPYYEQDYDSMLATTERSSGEKEFNECFSVSSYIDEQTKEEKMNIYKKPSYEEYRLSLRTSIKLGNLLLSYFNQGKNFSNFIPPKKINPNNLTLLEFLQSYAGKRYHIEMIDIEGALFPLKKYTNKVLIDYHAFRVMEFFWNVYNEQEEKGMFRSKKKERAVMEQQLNHLNAPVLM